MGVWGEGWDEVVAFHVRVLCEIIVLFFTFPGY